VTSQTLPLPAAAQPLPRSGLGVARGQVSGSAGAVGFTRNTVLPSATCGVPFSSLNRRRNFEDEKGTEALPGPDR
jgi:hypothetical protein